MITIGSFLGGLAALGATHPPASSPAAIPCTVEAKDSGELSPTEICAILAESVEAATGRSILVTMPTAWQARVAVRSADGSELAAKRVSVSDRSLYRAMWEKIAAELVADRQGRE